MTVSRVMPSTAEVSWEDPHAARDPYLTCKASGGGSCAILSVDHTARTASVEWTLPERVGTQGVSVAVGDADWWAADTGWVTTVRE